MDPEELAYLSSFAYEDYPALKIRYERAKLKGVNTLTVKKKEIDLSYLSYILAFWVPKKIN